MMTDYLVLSETQTKADDLMNRFIYLLHNTGEVKKVDRQRKIVYTNDGSSYMFKKNDRRFTDGYRGKIYGDIEFESMMKNFENRWNKQWWVNRQILKIINKLTGVE